MSTIKTTTAILFSWFILVFGLNALNISTFEIPVFAQLLAVLMSVTMLMLPQLGRAKIVVSSIAGLILFGALYLVNGANTSLMSALAGLIAVEGSILLTNILSARIATAERTAKIFSMGAQHLGVVSVDEGEQKLNDELYRARRLERPMAFVYCELNNSATAEAGSLNAQMTRTFRHRFQQIHLAKLASTLTYKNDVIVEFGDSLIIGLPETDTPEAQTFVNRLGKLVAENMSSPLVSGTAIFPDEGLAYEDLVHAARRDAQLWVETPVEEVERAGSVMVEVEERMKIEQQMDWVSQMPATSVTSRRIYNALKRSFDIAVVMMLLPTIFPVFAMLALAIWIDDRGPIFYKQWRTGYGGKRFQMYKFRSMIVNAPVVAATAVTMPDGSVRYMWPEKNGKDPRITRVGHIIRKTSLDELPQLLNVLKGDMTIVGPRPTTWDLDKYTRHQTARLAARPGITGLWQVSARDATNFDERLLWDMKYIDRANLWLDFQIIWLTVAQVFKRGGV